MVATVIIKGNMDGCWEHERLELKKWIWLETEVMNGFENLNKEYFSWTEAIEMRYYSSYPVAERFKQEFTNTCT